MYQFSNLHELRDFILEDKNFNKENKMENVKNISSSQEKINDYDYIKNTNLNDIAIIGISCDLPGEVPILVINFGIIIYNIKIVYKM